MKPARISREVGGAPVGDARRERRLMRTAAAMAAHPGSSVCAATGGWNESMGAYRVLASPHVIPQRVLAPHRECLLERAAGCPCVLLIQDTTELDFTSMRCMEGSGPLNDESRRGLFMHSHYAVSAAGLPLGLWEVAFLAREDAHFRRRSGARKKRPLSEKESVRWLEGWQHAQALAAALPHSEVFAVSDREGDIYEIYAAWDAAGRAGGAGAQWLIRASQDRALENTAAGSPEKLFAALAQAPLLGTMDFEVPAKKQMKKKRGGSRVTTLRSARRVCQEIRAMEVTLRPPFRQGERLPSVKLWALLAREIDPPSGEEPLCWVLLTSVPVKTLAQAQRLIGYYLRRWDIEVFHRVLKTGCRAESLQLKNGGAVRNALILHAITAWRILYLTQIARVAPDEPCEVVFAPAEWRAARAVAMAGRARDAPAPPSLREIIGLIARFGGHLGRKRDGAPGPQVLWRGLVRLRDFTCAWEALNAP